MPLPLDALRDLVGPEHVLTSDHDLVAYSTDATPLQRALPEAVVLAGNRDEIAGVLRLAEEHRFPVTPRASGTNLSGGAVPLARRRRALVRAHAQLIEIDEQNLTATCEPGLQNALLQEAVAAKGLFYPPDPGSQVISTIGGNVMECSGGLRGLKYGITRDYVIGLEAVLMGGRVLRVGGKLTKDVAGYDLVRLLVGSEGTLAVLTEITLKLLPAPEAKATGAAYFRDLEASARSVSRIIENRILPATLEFLDQATMRVVDESAGLGLPADAGAMLIFGQDGAASVVERDTAKMAEICREEGAISVEVAADEDAAGKLLAARRGAIPALARLAPTLILEDATVPRSELAGMVRDVQRIAEEEGLLIAVFGHAGDGNLHPTCCIDDRDPDQVARVHRAFEPHLRGRARARRARSRASTASASPSCSTWSSASGPSGIDLLRGIKRAFDPLGLLNPGQGGAVSAPDVAAPGRGLFPDDLLRTCISCGFCLSACPTYQDTRNEASSPRGRINLMRALEAGTLRRGRRARGVLVLPRLPRVRAGLPGGRALRHAARARPRRRRAGPRSQAARPAAGRRHAAPHAARRAG